MSAIPTMRVKSEAAPGGFYLLNVSDFDPAIHEDFDAPAKPAPKKAAAAPASEPAEPPKD